MGSQIPCDNAKKILTVLVEYRQECRRLASLTTPDYTEISIARVSVKFSADRYCRTRWRVARAQDCGGVALW